MSEFFGCGGTLARLNFSLNVRRYQFTYAGALRHTGPIAPESENRFSAVGLCLKEHTIVPTGESRVPDGIQQVGEVDVQALVHGVSDHRLLPLFHLVPSGPHDILFEVSQLSLSDHLTAHLNARGSDGEGWQAPQVSPVR